MDATALLDALRGAHRQHLLGQLRDPQQWHSLLTDLHQQLQAVPIGKLIDSDALATVVDGWLQQADTAQALQPVIEKVTLQLWEAAKNDPASFGELLNEEHFEAILEEILKLETLREKAIHAAMSHPLVSEMVSEMLYTGIKNFLLEENALTKLPGVGSMMKLGRKSVGKAMGGMEDSIRDYLRQNIRVTLRSGENWLKQQLSNERISRLARDGYQRLAPLKPADALTTIPASSIRTIVRQGCVIGDETANLAYTRRLVSAGIHASIDALLEMTLAQFLDGMGISDQQLRDLTVPALTRGAEVLIDEGALEPVLHWLVDDFYQSEQCRKLVDG